MDKITLSQCFQAGLCKDIREQTGRRIAEPDADLKLDDLGFDEVDRSIVALILEEDWKVPVPEGSEHEWKTLGDVFALLDATRDDAQRMLNGGVGLLLDAAVTEPAVIAEATSATLSQLDALSKAGKLGKVS